MWLESNNDPGFQILNNDEILSFVQDKQQTVIDDEDGEDEQSEENRKRGPSHEEIFTALETAMSWYEY